LAGGKEQEGRKAELPHARQGTGCIGHATSDLHAVRPENLSELEFDTHLFVRAGATSIELESEEVKNDNAIGYDIPTHLAKMLHDRDRIAPKHIGHRPRRLFVKLEAIPRAKRP
jgi:hypothetical protein